MIKVILNRGEKSIEQIQKSIQILDEIEKDLISNKKLVLDLSDVKWVLPCFALLLGHKINVLQKEGFAPELIRPEDLSARNYLSAIGFPFGREAVKQTYCPINHLIRNNNRVIPSFEEQIAKTYDIVTAHFPSSLTNGIMHFISELTDNIDQHSDFSNASVMVQMYKNQGHIDIGVYDDGISIPGAYLSNNLPFDSDLDAIKKALKGVSTKKEPGRGTGLRSVQNLLVEGLSGELSIVSRDGFIHFRDRETLEYHNKGHLKGTFAYIRFKVPEKELNIYPYISRYEI